MIEKLWPNCELWLYKVNYIHQSIHQYPRSIQNNHLSLLGSQMRIFIRQHKLNGIEEIGFTRSISTHHNIVPGIKWIYNCLFSVGFKSLNNNLLDVHHFNIDTIWKINQRYFSQQYIMEMQQMLLMILSHVIKINWFL